MSLVSMAKFPFVWWKSQQILQNTTVSTLVSNAKGIILDQMNFHENVLVNHFSANNFAGF